MPFDFTNLRTYQINYNKLYEHFKTFPILDDDQLKKDYLFSWMTILEMHDKKLISQCNTKEKISNHLQKEKDLEKHLEKDIETFTQEMIYNDITVLINFRIHIVYELLKGFHKPPFVLKIDLKEFIENTSTIMWTEREINTTRKFNSNPIYLIPFYSGQYTQLVIDGNHRISQAIKMQQKTIASLNISEQAVIEQENIFTSSFDRLFYIFNNELNHFANYKQRDLYTDKMLLNKSFLTNGKLNFIEI